VRVWDEWQLLLLNRFFDLFDNFETCQFYGRMFEVERAFCDECCVHAQAIAHARRRCAALNNDDPWREYQRGELVRRRGALAHHLDTVSHEDKDRVHTQNLGTKLNAFRDEVQYLRATFPNAPGWKKKFRNACRRA